MTATFTDALSTRRIKGGSGGVPQVVGALGSLVDARPRQSKRDGNRPIDTVVDGLTLRSLLKRCHVAH